MALGKGGIQGGVAVGAYSLFEADVAFGMAAAALKGRPVRHFLVGLQ
jgi:hypothetical protein